MTDPNPYTRQVTEGVDELSAEGRALLDPQVTNLDGDIYALTDEMDAHTRAAAAARYSRTANDLRVVVAKEMSGSDYDVEMLWRTTNEYGDDSVGQMFTADVVVNGTSQLVVKQLEWSRIGVGYIEKSTRYVAYNQRDADGNYPYVQLPQLPLRLREMYTQSMDAIFDRYAAAFDGLLAHVRQTSEVPEDKRDAVWRAATKSKALDAARVILPTAAKANTVVHATAQAFSLMAIRLLSSDVPESRRVGAGMLAELRKISPVFFERTAWEWRGGEHVRYLRDTREALRAVAAELLPPKAIEIKPGQEVRLTDYTPRDEFDLVPFMLFDSADGYSIEELKEICATLSIEQKLAVMHAYMGEPTNRRHRPGRALERSNYGWGIVSDFGIFRDLQRHRIVDDLRWQRLTPEHGMEIPELAQMSGTRHYFEEAEMLSRHVYEALRSEGFAEEAQYATLLGHKLYWTVKTNGRSNKHMFELRSTPQGHPSYRALVQRMYSLVAAVHPNLARLSMPFMNMSEDPELGRQDSLKSQSVKGAIRERVPETPDWIKRLS
ncbi:FAD-dependent thymidylate synthase [Candidatus Microgenomates bacterium]|nr:FAD-dependent thymidylate synthase [Candidatus Microgenomates bacterium]